MNSNQLEVLKREINQIKLSTMPSHKELRERKIEERKNLTIDKILNKVQIKIDELKLTEDRKEVDTTFIESDDDTFAPEISVIIPYMHSEERYPLLLACLSRIPSSVEICIVEIGTKRYLNIEERKIKYMFIEYNNIFHRGVKKVQ